MDVRIVVGGQAVDQAAPDVRQCLRLGASVTMKLRAPTRLIRYCGADCSDCGTYRRFLVGDESRVVNADTGYRCCWLPAGYPEGMDCPIRVCCEERGVLYCGLCAELETCRRMEAFYSQPGYDALKQRMLEEAERVG